MLRPLTDTDPTVIGPYRLHHRIGSGGMGVVYLGYGADDQPVAVKVPHESFATSLEFRGRFRAEVAAARRVRAPSVARVIDSDVDCPRPWLATEYVEGPTLHAAALAATGPLTGRSLDGLAIGLADALTAIHALGVVHRDLKPANVVLSWQGPKVIDFGVARSTDYSGYTQAGELVGTVAWMSPEQLGGEVAGPASDVFAWACCVVYAATGRRPFAGESQEVVALRITTAEPDLDGVPAHLLDVVCQGLAKRPTHRPTAAELLALLTAQPQDHSGPGRTDPTPTANPTSPANPTSAGGTDGQSPDDDRTRLTGRPPLEPPAPPAPLPTPTPASPLTSPLTSLPRDEDASGGTRPAPPRPAGLVTAGLVLGLVTIGLLGAGGVWAAGTGHAPPVTAPPAGGGRGPRGAPQLLTRPPAPRGGG
ncbi:serine/threonine-protein kinase, partial [Frankia sp. AgB32]|uniref:serine/threonine-protein kinase n=1 Tax=Frankia sp. AgB32 TaxID=631119 RepID=UPI00200DC26D